MASQYFSLDDYQKGLASGCFKPPSVLCPYYTVDPILYKINQPSSGRKGDVRKAFHELRRRTGREYFRKIYPLQTWTLGYSARTFPAYQFVLPEVMTEDWLAMVDWGKFQRDHVLHQPLCGYIILKLLDGDHDGLPLKLPNGKTLLDSCVETILKWQSTAYIRDFLILSGMDEDDPLLCPSDPRSKPVWRALFREAAYVAAIFHDLGYPWQYAGRMQSRLEGMNAAALQQSTGAGQILNEFHGRLLIRALEGYRSPTPTCPSNWKERLAQLIGNALANTHGLPGALGFLFLNDCVRRYPNGKESAFHLLCVEWIAVSIMMHNMSGIYWGHAKKSGSAPENPFLQVKFDSDPLSALVTLTDIIQDFERPFGLFRKCGRPESVSLGYDIACKQTELSIDSKGNLTLTYHMTSDGARADKRSHLPNEQREFFDPHYGYLDLKGLGINSVQMRAV